MPRSLIRLALLSCLLPALLCVTGCAGPKFKQYIQNNVKLTGITTKKGTVIYSSIHMFKDFENARIGIVLNNNQTLAVADISEQSLSKMGARFNKAPRHATTSWCVLGPYKFWFDNGKLRGFTGSSTGKSTSYYPVIWDYDRKRQYRFPLSHQDAIELFGSNTRRK